uniref:Secreted protein n=1 Tax=Macrostomum lignano TaxID=282301 RepID=A0A1I8I7X7_9PLAT
MTRSSRVDLNWAFCCLCSSFLAVANCLFLIFGIACIVLSAVWQQLLQSSNNDSSLSPSAERRQLVDCLQAVAAAAGIKDVSLAAQNALSSIGPIDTALLIL